MMALLPLIVQGSPAQAYLKDQSQFMGLDKGNVAQNGTVKGFTHLEELAL